MSGAYHAHMDGIGWAASAMNAARVRLDTATENLANGSTDGFRKTDVRGFLTARGVAMERSRSAAQGPLRRTGRPFDLAIIGSGEFRVRGSDGRAVSTRNGAFTRDRFSRLVDDAGRVLLGNRGPVRVPDGARIEENGSVTRNGIVLERIALPAGSSVRSGFLESSNVDAIGEMIDVLTAQRSFESAQKVLSAIDQTRERASTQVAQLK
ncbi:MAG TPA: flagellar basal body rod C-terminal domain-containing protein [Candidatus Baltobacteraceae bacterium]|nr:flagellar basal body rod C-terminal domain-containing protein [Candidatus Baltobacteraceae bacterium]